MDLISKLKNIKPDFDKPDSYQHGFHDAIEVVLANLGNSTPVLTDTIKDCLSKGIVVQFSKFLNQNSVTLSLPTTEISLDARKLAKPDKDTITIVTVLPDDHINDEKLSKYIKLMVEALKQKSHESIPRNNTGH